MLKSLRNGLVNCPACSRVVAARGAPESLFWICLGGATLLAALIAAAVFLLAGPIWGWIAVGAGVLGIGALVVAA